MTVPTAWSPTSPCGPGCLPPRVVDAGLRRARRLARTARRLAAITAVLLLGAVLALAAPLLGPARTARAAQVWCSALLRAAGVRTVVTGPRPAPGSLLVANHVSWLDVLALNRVVGVRMLAKAEVREWPLIGAMAARAGSVFVERDRLRALPHAVAAVAAALAEGGCVGVFAEGTTRCGRDLGPFRPAACQAAVDTGAPVVPIALAYADTDGGPDAAAAFVGDDTLLASLIRVAAARRTVLTVRVLSAVTAPVPGALPAPGRAAARRALGSGVAAAVAAALPGPDDDPRPRPAVHPLPVPAPAPSTAAAPSPDDRPEPALPGRAA